RLFHRRLRLGPGRRLARRRHRPRLARHLARAGRGGGGRVHHLCRGLQAARSGSGRSAGRGIGQKDTKEIEGYEGACAMVSRYSVKTFVRGTCSFVSFASFVSLAFLTLSAQVPPGQLGYQDTPMTPNGKWHIHDGKRPQPDIVTPNGPVTTPPPTDAIVLLGPGADLGKWQMQEGGGAVTWAMSDGVLQTGKGMIQTKQTDFTDFQLHVEF